MAEEEDTTPVPGPGPAPDPNPTLKSSIPYHQIRADYDTNTITLYQAYSPTIALLAIKHQRLNASSAFSPTRMTWLKPSWAWMMYRSNYSLKDARQSCILALKIPHVHFATLLSEAVCLSGRHGRALNAEEKDAPVRVQWDPERTPALGICSYRSIQIGVKGDSEVGRRLVGEWIVGIEDVTDRALGLKRVLEEEPGLGVGELVERGVMPVEREYVVSESLKERLMME